jgi:L-alanine-DL-glutamate epimerase-like enolase superfamily enzyme
MARTIRITRILVTHYAFEVKDLGAEERLGFDAVYRSGAVSRPDGSILTVETDAGVKGEVPGGIDARSAQYLLGRNPLHRDSIWHDLKRSQRGRINAPPGAVDVALWDIAGKVYGAPIYELLGGGGSLHGDETRMTLPCYASTYHGDENGGLTRPEDYGEYALFCKEEHGYPAFKIHGWIGGSIQREVEAVLAIREAVGEEMALMLDPAGAFRTFDDVLRVGRACDEARYFWYEDAFRGGGLSQFAHAKLREFVKTPLLMGEHIRGLEAKADTIATKAADYVRANAGVDGGITGVMKIAALAEANGLDVELHGPSLAHRHCMAALRNSNYYELGLVHPKVKDNRAPIYRDPKWLDLLESVDEHGCVEVPTGPGLGVELDWEWIGRNKTGETVFEG